MHIMIIWLFIRNWRCCYHWRVHNKYDSMQGLLHVEHQWMENKEGRQCSFLLFVSCVCVCVPNVLLLLILVSYSYQSLFLRAGTHTVLSNMAKVWSSLEVLIQQWCLLAPVYIWAGMQMAGVWMKLLSIHLYPQGMYIHSHLTCPLEMYN